jgi:hypothetical protein
VFDTLSKGPGSQPYATQNAVRSADSNWVISDPVNLIDGVVAPAKCTVQLDPLSSVIVVIMFGLMMA